MILFIWSEALHLWYELIWLGFIILGILAMCGGLNAFSLVETVIHRSCLPDHVWWPEYCLPFGGEV